MTKIRPGPYEIWYNLFTYQVWLPQTLARTKQLVTGSSADNENLVKVDAPDAVKSTDERLPSFVIYTRNNRADKEWAESLLV